MRGIEHDLIVQKEPFKERTRPIKTRSFMGRKCLAHYIEDASLRIYTIEQSLFCLVDRHIEVFISMASVDQNGRGPGRQSFFNADRIRHSNGDITQPDIAAETDLLGAIRIIVSVSNHAVANHRAPKQFDGGVLLCQGKLCHQASLRDARRYTTLGTVGCLSDPTTKCHSCPLEEIEQFRH